MDLSENANDDQCINCGNDDFVDDISRGDTICNICGLVQSVIFSDAKPYSELFDDYGNRSYPGTLFGFSAVPISLPNLRVNVQSAPYSEATYLNERIAQWRQIEPAIPQNDELCICTAYKGDGESVSKDEIRALLAGIDTRRIGRGKQARFIRKYLEKWLSIRFMLTGVKSRGCVAPDWLVNAVRKRFNSILVPFKKHLKGNGRYSMINLNFVFRRIFDIEGVPWYSIDFPPLKTESKRRKLVNMWVECCKYTGYPYINRDAQIFPYMKFYRPIAWSEIYDGRGRNSNVKRRRTNDPAAAEKRFNKSAKRWSDKYYALTSHT